MKLPWRSVLSVVVAGCAACAPAPPASPPADTPLGLRSVVFHVADLGRARAWYSEVLRKQPYFDEPYYVGFDVGGYELGLDPDLSLVSAGGSGLVAYWRVLDVAAAFERLTALGAVPVTGVQEVGGETYLAILRDPFGNLVGIIEQAPFDP